MNVIVTGCAGFIGFHLSKQLLEQKVNVYGLDNLSSVNTERIGYCRLQILKNYKNFFFSQKSINQINTITFPKKIDLIINLAAVPGVRLEREKYDIYLESNVQGFKAVLDYAVSNKVNKIIFASSSSVYGANSNLPFLESETDLSPESFYGLTKKFNEDYAKFYSKKYELNITALRFFSVYGEYGRPDMAYFYFADQMKKGSTIRLNNMGKMKRDMTYIDDILCGIGSVIDYMNDSNKKHSYEVFNLGNDNPIEISYMLKFIEENLSVKAKIIESNSFNELIVTHADLKKANKILGYKPKIKFEEGMEQFLKWYKNFFWKIYFFHISLITWFF